MQYFTAYFGDINKNVVRIFSATPNLQNIRFLHGHLSSPWCIMYEDVHFEKQKCFESTEHEKAWLIRVSQNVCKNMLRANSRRCESPTGDIAVNDSSAVSDVMIELSALPDELKIPVYLFYCDGYNSKEIGSMLHISASAVRSRLQKARERLKEHLGSERSIV